MFEGPKPFSFNKEQHELLYCTVLMRHFLALRAFKSEEECFIESDAAALEAEATWMYQAAAMRAPAEPWSFTSRSADGPT